MAKRAVTRKPGQIEQQIGTGGATHQIRARDGMHLTTKLIPEELHPLRMVGRMVLKRPPPGGVTGQFRVSAGTPRPLPR